MSSPFRDTSLILECPKCETLNYLDPFTFWNFKGKIKCAGCDAIWAYELVNGPGKPRRPPPRAARQDARVRPEQGLEDDHRLLEGQQGPQAREDFQGKPIPISKSKRGNPVSGTR